MNGDDSIMEEEKREGRGVTDELLLSPQYISIEFSDSKDGPNILRPS